MSDFYFHSDDVRAAARNGWQSILMQFGAGAEQLTGSHSACPGCGGRDRFRFDDKEGDGTFLCSQGGGGILAGDGINLVEHIKGCEWKEAVNLVGQIVCPEKARACGSGLPRPSGPAQPTVTPPPEAAQAEKSLKFNIETLRRFRRPDIAADFDYFAARSSVDVAAATSATFLDTLFAPEEKVLIFTNERSQGQFVHWVGHGSYVLADRPNVQAKRSILPRGGRDGVWFLCQPVDGRWYPNPRAPRLKNGELRLSRRSMEAVTAWRYMVLESDEAPDDLWLNFLAQLPLPIAAIYTSGRRSIHALVKFNLDSKEEWDGIKRQVAPLFTKLGADAGALSAVRLTRLPGCYRGDNLQRLLYLNGSPEPGLPICSIPELATT